MYAEITKQFRFEAAHRLPLHGGKCRNLHGHSYRVEVTIGGDLEEAPISSQGMVVDFADMTARWKAMKGTFDHSGTIIELTAEQLAGEILRKFQETRTFGEKVTEVTVWETDTARATVRA